jgi:hypothetical protein
MKIGFDLDKIFISLPPLIPSRIIDFLYKEEANHELKYRIPSKAEQLFRIFTHHPFFRHPILKNIKYVKKLSLSDKNKYYIVSSRFGFLKKRTYDFIKKNCLDKIFDSIYFNYSNLQPHKFKDKMVKKLNLDLFVDDDLQLLEYLANKNPKTNFFWLNDNISKSLGKNLTAIKSI